MKPFMDKDFMLQNETAKELYHDAAAAMPIFDYHCHLNPKEIADNIQFRNIGHLFLGGDHYKWRAMLSNGVSDECIRGNASDWDKFLSFAKMLKYAVGNPLFHWTHLELQRVFGIDDILSEKTAKAIWDRANAMLATDEFRCKRLIEKFNVALVCTTDDPVDDLTYHAQIKEDVAFKCKVLPAFRPDKAINIDRPGFQEYIEKLEAVSGVNTGSLDGLLKALEKRVDYFHANGARVSDHALDKVPYAEPDMALAASVYQAALKGEALCQADVEAYKTVVLQNLGRMYHQRGWVMQYHIGAQRNNNSRMFKTYGADIGFDSIADYEVAEKLAKLLSLQDEKDELPKTILYCLNPKDNYTLGTMIGNFQGGTPGKLQFGSGWWFCDQRDGMTDQMKSLANLGLLGRFIGMLTDSRSFISYPRHEYFRRILCNLLGTWVEEGEFPADMELLKELVRGISFNNAKEYFGIDL